jgi:acyl-coenzyme A thioesterase PaaI-like protein
VNLVRTTDRGTLTAEAEILHRGRTTIVVDVQVLDDQRRFVTKLVTTQLALPPAPSRA